MTRRLYRSRDDRMIAGVAGGLAERLDIDSALVRIVWAVLVLPTGFLALLVYVIAALVVPDEDDQDVSMTAGAWPASPPPPGSPIPPPTWPGTPGAPPATWTGTPPAAPGPSMPMPMGAVPPSRPMGATPPPALMGTMPPGSPAGPTPPIPPPMDRYMSRRDRRRAARAARRADRTPGSATLVVGGGLIVLGSWFLLREYIPALDASRFWPVAVVGLGILLVILAIGRRSDGAGGGH